MEYEARPEIPRETLLTGLVQMQVAMTALRYIGDTPLALSIEDHINVYEGAVLEEIKQTDFPVPYDEAIDYRARITSALMAFAAAPSDEFPMLLDAPGSTEQVVLDGFELQKAGADELSRLIMGD